MNATPTTSAEIGVTRLSDRTRQIIFAVAAVGCGVLFAIQGRVNGELGSELGDGLLAAAISFGSGLVLLLVIALFYRRMRIGMRRIRQAVRDGELRRWHVYGGVGGAAFVASQSITVGVLGVALFTVGVVAGQTLSGLLVDKIGLGPAGPQALTLSRIGGALLTLAGVGLSLSGGLEAHDGLALVIFPLLAGIGLAVQQALNGRVANAARTAFSAGLLNFIVGTVSLVFASAVAMLLVYGLPSTLPSDPVLYLGGPAGVLFICSAANLVGKLGVLLMSLCLIAGQLIGSVLLDLFMPSPGEQLSTSTLVGAGLTLVAVVLATLPGRKPAGSRQGA